MAVLPPALFFFKDKEFRVSNSLQGMWNCVGQVVVSLLLARATGSYNKH